MSAPIKVRPWAKQGDIFLVWCPEQDETEEDAREVESRDAESAAEDFAEWDDAGGDYAIIGGWEPTVHVRRKDVADAPVEVFVVSGESVPQYSATKAGP